MSTDPFALSDALVDEIAALRPVTATFAGIPGHDDRWDDLSPEGHARFVDLLRAWRGRYAALPPQQGRWGALAVRVTLDWIDQAIDAFAHHDHRTDLDSIASPFQTMRMVFDSMDTTTAAGWEAVAKRLATLDQALSSYRASLAEGLAADDVVAARQVRAAIEQGRVHAGERSFFRGLLSRYEACGVGDPALAERIRAGVEAACAAYGAMADWLEGTYLPKARAADGVGRERYLRRMRHFLGTTPDPEETYAWGWREVARILGEMTALAARIEPGRSLSQVLTAMKEDPARGAPDRETFLARMDERQKAALAALDGTHFEVPEVLRRLDVKQAPPGGPLGAYYVPPSEDFSRRGAVWYAFGDSEGPFPLFDEISTAYHEGFPGHHLQCGLQVSFTSELCRLHRLLSFYSGYAEGWALYAEQLMGELGFYEQPDYELGRLVNEMVRACRVAFDIGAHLDLPIPDDAPFHPGERWTYALGVELLTEVAGLQPDYAASEITRYLGWPAQAISYKVGMRVMLELREAFLARGGTLRDFHGRVLGCGNLSLELLRDQVLGET